MLVLPRINLEINIKVCIIQNKVGITNIKVGIAKNKVGNTNINVGIIKNKVGITNIKVDITFDSTVFALCRESSMKYERVWVPFPPFYLVSKCKF
jgi:uncharacterized RmlC-like cupin family protein